MGQVYIRNDIYFQVVSKTKTKSSKEVNQFIHDAIKEKLEREAK